MLARGVQPWGQFLTCDGMLILTQPEKIYSEDFTGQSEPLGGHSKPFTGHSLAFLIVVPDAQMLLEVFSGVLEFVLRLRGDHAPDIIRTVHAFCVSHTFSETRIGLKLGS